jgi:hypothetical protein
MVDIGRFLIGQGVSCRKRSNNRASRPADPSTVQSFRRLGRFVYTAIALLAILEIDLHRRSGALGLIESEEGITRGSANQKGRPDWPFSSH